MIRLPWNDERHMLCDCASWGILPDHFNPLSSNHGYDLSPSNSVVVVAPKQATGQALSVVTTGRTVPIADADQVTDAFGAGAKVGGKAVTNAAIDTTVSTATLGLKDAPESWKMKVTQADLGEHKEVGSLYSA